MIWYIIRFVTQRWKFLLALLILLGGAGYFLFARVVVSPAKSQRWALDELMVPKFIGLMYYTDVENNEEYSNKFSFNIRWEDANSPDVEKGEIFKQEPAYGKTVKKGATITLYVNSGTSKDITLDVRAEIEGAYKKDVRKLLQDAGFVVDETLASSDTIPADHVIGISIDKGKAYPYGAVVTMVVSAGPAEDEPLAFPPILGADYKEAIDFLRRTGFEGSVDLCHQNVAGNRYDPKDRVIGVKIDGVLQQYLPNRVAPDAAITLVVSTGLRDVVVELEWPNTDKTIDVRAVVNGVVDNGLLEKYSSGIKPSSTTKKLTFTLAEHRAEAPYLVEVQVKLHNSSTSEYQDYVTLCVDPVAGDWTFIEDYQPLPGITPDPIIAIPADIFSSKLTVEQINNKLSPWVVAVREASGQAITMDEYLYVTEIWYNGSLVRADDVLPPGAMIEVVVVKE